MHSNLQEKNISLPRLWNTTAAVQAVGQLTFDLFGRGAFKQAGHRPVSEQVVPSDFVGICVAANVDPTGDAFIIEQLRELRVRNVRIDLVYSSSDETQNDCQQRLVAALIEAGFKVGAHLAPSLNDGVAISHRQTGDAALARWRLFITSILKQWGQHLEWMEIGATCNRRKWSGMSLNGFLTAWQIAYQEAQTYGVTIVGPNVTDFEPIYNAYLLKKMRRAGAPPAIHTNNLFVERATEPENFDHKILGHTAARLLRCNLMRKARLLQALGSLHGVPRFYCTHVAWSLRRIARFLEHTEEKQADYLTRYYLLAAASGAFERVYWGPMIGQREGLIDDVTDEYPDIPHVTIYNRAPGAWQTYRTRPAFRALQAFNRLVCDSAFQKALTAKTGIEVLEFKTADGRCLHAAWTTNGHCALATSCYAPQTLAAAICYSRDGTQQNAPDFLTESPVYLLWNQPPCLTAEPALSIWRIAKHTKHVFAPLKLSGWNGIYCASAPTGQTINSHQLADILPRETVSNAELQSTNAEKHALRAGRNQVWSCPAPWDKDRNLVIKQFNIPGRLRRLLDYGKSSKTVRSWNGAQELLRRGLPTPLPLAAMIPDQQDNTRPGYYVCADFMPDCSVRDVFTALASGEPSYHEREAAAWFALIAAFLTKMHDRGVFFRDLSAGNLLVRYNPRGTSELSSRSDEECSFSLIDTGRARFYPWRLPLHQRLSDLTRICHPLHWDGRRALLRLYMELAGYKYCWWHCLSLICYDTKHIIKRMLKPLRSKR